MNDKDKAFWVKEPDLDKGKTMTFKQFLNWCNERVCDGCWGYKEAVVCIDIISEVKRIPFWKREKVWKEKYCTWVVHIVNIIDQKIQEVYGERNDNG